LDLPILVGPSRKHFLAHPDPEREPKFATAAAVTACVLGGAHIVRVHDVREMRAVTEVADEISPHQGGLDTCNAKPLPLHPYIAGIRGVPQTPTRLLDYALVLTDPPVAARSSPAPRSTAPGPSPSAANSPRPERRALGVGAPPRECHLHLSDLAQRRICDGHREEAAQLAGMPGVVRVVHLPRYKPALDKAWAW